MQQLGSERSSNRIVAIICCLFFILGLYLVYTYGRFAYLGSLQSFNNDDVKYVRSAWTLVEHKMLICSDPTQPTVFIMPGMSLLLALFILIFGKFSGLIAFRIFQLLLQIASLLLIYAIAQKVFCRKTAVLAVLADALYLPEIWLTNLILTEVTFKFLLLGLVYLSGRALQKKQTAAYFWVGLAWSVATLFRPTIALYALILPPLWWYSRYSLKDTVKYSLVISLVFVSLLSPWWLRNYHVFHRFIPLTLASGNPMLQGTYINNDDSHKAEDSLNYSAYYKAANNEIEIDRAEKALAIKRLQTVVPQKPLAYIYWYTIGKTFYQWYVPFLLGNLNSNLILFATGFHWLLLIGFILGLLKLKSQPKNCWLILILAVLIYFNFMHLPFLPFSRYMYPTVPLLIIISSYAFMSLSQQWLANRLKKHTSYPSSNRIMKA